MFKLIEKYWPPSFIINRNGQPYLRRRYLIPKNKFFNIYLHHFLDDDIETACHNHPWWSIGVLIKGSYLEVTPKNKLGKKVTRFLPKLRSPDYYHRIKLYNKYRCENCYLIDGSYSALRGEDVFKRVEWSGFSNVCPECIEETGKQIGKTEVWSIFITGPKIQDWGFLCPKGYIGHKEVILKQEKNLHDGIECP